MKFKYIALLSLFFVGNFAQAENKNVINLTERNTLALRNVIDSQSVVKVEKEANRVSQNLSHDEEIFLFMDTPGGEIQAGKELITVLQGLPQKVNTITNFAASMGFITVQSLGTRYILPGGILMSHRAAGGASGQIPGELNSRVDFFTDMLDAQDTEISERLNMSKQAYQKSIQNEYWIYGKKAVKNHAADKVVLVRCDKTLSEGTTTEVVNTFFGPVSLKYSNCPLLTAPLSIDFSGLQLSEYIGSDQLKLAEIRKAILTLVYNKREFYHDYVLTNKYKNLMP